MSIAENHGGLYKNLQLLRETKGQAGLNLFKAMGFDYLYVDKGNDVASLIEAFKKVNNIDHPVVVHINTLKGKGYKYAEQEKERWHWGYPPDFDNAPPFLRQQMRTLVFQAVSHYRECSLCRKVA